MEKNQAAELIKKTFTQGFDEAQFTYFIRNLLNHVDESSAFTIQGNYIRDAYREHVRQYKRLGKYTDPAGLHVEVLVVKLKRETALDRARTMQRNFIAWYLNGGRGGVLRDAALVAFHADELEDWRFSFVRMDYRTAQDETGAVRIEKELTPARRSSFLVGPNEPNHTAQQQLVPLLEDDVHNPTLDAIEQAFTIESVTREFFSRYRDLFLRLREEIDSLLTEHPRAAADFAAKKISTADFAKKLLGQIVFLYFLQKKGWLGVQKDGGGALMPWGSGPRHFLRRLFNRDIVPYDNFFNDLLEPLFYEALAIDRGEEAYYSPFRCRIPFLNGGLFEPIGGYSWEQTDILISNNTFAEIFGIFDLYNFTVREDEPLEKEVAVDPEMLGKVFENLLEVKDRKSKGAYYTPREIVHYMCQESLIRYLDTVLNTRIGFECFSSPQSALFGPEEMAQPGRQVELMAPCGEPVIPREHLDLFIRLGDFSRQNDLRVTGSGRETPSYSFELPETIRVNAHRLDDALANIKICDPAIGSGAFPVGMLHEIVRARETLTIYLGTAQPRTVYDFKRHAIQQSIYGVDIDTGAVEIAKLRLWLSLVVDEDDFNTIKPLPNLDYKIVCGDSLQKVVRNVLNDHLFKELEGLKQRFFDEINPRQKKEEKARITELIADLTNNDEHFDYEIYYSEVFHQKGGFDVVIANPPYVRQEAIKEIKPTLKKQFGDFYCGTADLYTYFYKRGLEILKPSGHLCFIAPNKFMRAGYGKNTRKLLAGEAKPKVVIDFGDLPIFDATTYPSILLIEKKQPTAADRAFAATFTDAAQLGRLEETLGQIGFDMPITALKPDGWNLERPDVLALMEKLRSTGTPLGKYVEGRFYRGVLTGLNEAFVIDEATRQRLIAEDPKSAELIKPWLRGKDIRKWKAEWAGLHVIFTRRGVDIDKYPAIKHHLAQFRQDLEPKKAENDKRGRKPGPYQWFEIQDNIAYYHEFEKPKIMYPDIAQHSKFLLDENGAFSSNTTYFIPTSEMWFLGLLNSKLMWWFYGSITSTIRGGFVRYFSQYMEQLPIANASDSQQAAIVERVQTILAASDSPDVQRLEAEIDELVYQLYGLTPEEIALVEGKK